MNHCRIVSIVLSVIFLFLCAACGRTEEEVKKNAQEIIEEMVVDRGSYGAEADERVKELLQESDRQVMAVENCGMAGEAVYCSADEIPEDAGYFTIVIA